MRAADPDEYLDMDDSDVDDFEAVHDRNAAVLTCARVHLEDNSMFSSAKRACTIPPPVSRILTQPDIEMGTVPLPVPEDAMEVDFDAGVEPTLVPRGAKRASAMWEERADQTDMEVCPDATGECCNRDAVETLSWYATVGGIRTEQECEMFRRWHENEKLSMQTVSSSTLSHPNRLSRPLKRTDTSLDREFRAFHCIHYQLSRHRETLHTTASVASCRDVHHSRIQTALSMELDGSCQVSTPLRRTSSPHQRR